MQMIGLNYTRRQKLEEINVMLDKGAFPPIRCYNQDAGLDLCTPKDVTIKPGSHTVIDTGVHIEIPEGYVGMLKSKSGLNIRHEIIGEGVIDAGYTGSIMAKLYNLGKSVMRFARGDKVIQLVILPIMTPKINLVTEFSETARGDSGFGSTGR